jgi:hypothetical protein
MFKDLANEIDKIARLVEADFDPESIAKKENSGSKIEEQIKNRANYDWKSKFDSQQHAPKGNEDIHSMTLEEGESQAASAYRGKMNNLMFLGSAVANELVKIAEALDDEGVDFEEDKPEPRAARKRKADFDPNTINKSKNSGEKVEQRIQNGNFDWLSEFQGQQQAPKQGSKKKTQR